MDVRRDQAQADTAMPSGDGTNEKARNRGGITKKSAGMKEHSNM